MLTMIGKGDDRGRWIFLVIAVFAVAGAVIPRVLAMPRDKIQTVLVIALLPVALLTVWLLRGEKPASPTEGAPGPSEPASSEDE